MKAITHDHQKLGGVVISAGAGSGKTSVLVERVLFLIEKKFSYLNSGRRIQDYKDAKNIEAFLKNIIVVTFTIKAAKEMKTRIQKRIEDYLANNAEDKNLWKIVQSSMGYLFIGTIDSFCSRFLIKHNEYIGTNINLQVSSRNYLLKKIKTILRGVSVTFNNLEAKLYWENEEGWIRNVEEIFSRPEIRKKVISELSLSQEMEFGHEAYLRQFQKKEEESFFHYLEIKKVGSILIDIAKSYKNEFSHKKGKDKKSWMIWLELYIEFLEEKKTVNEDFLTKFFKFIEFNPIPRKPTTNEFKEVSCWMSDFKLLAADCEEIFHCYKLFKEESFQNDIQLYFCVLKKIIEAMEKQYLNLEGLGFSDFQYYTDQLLNHFSSKNNNYFKDYFGGDFPYFIIDELQDTSMFQLEIFLKLANNRNQNLFGVGDSKQSIYSFRGGDQSVFSYFKSIVKNQIDLEDNYRSTDKVVQFNNVIFSNLFQLTDSKFQISKSHLVEEFFDKIEIFSEKDSLNEVETDRSIEEELETKKIYSIVKFITSKDMTGDIAILCRTNSEVREMCAYLDHQQISFETEFVLDWDEDIGFQLLYYLVLLVDLKLSDSLENFNQDLSLAKKRSNEFLVKQVRRLFEKMGSVYNQQYLEDYFLRIELFDYVINFNLFLTDSKIILPYGSNFLSFFNTDKFLRSLSLAELIVELEKLRFQQSKLSWIRNHEHNKDNKTDHLVLPQIKNKIIVQTVHASKGLEYDYVILSGLNNRLRITNSRSYFTESIFQISFKYFDEKKNKKNFKSISRISNENFKAENERLEMERLFYVACTRAKRNLFLILPSKLYLKERTLAELVYKNLDSEHTKSILNKNIVEVSDENFSSAFLKQKLLLNWYGPEQNIFQKLISGSHRFVLLPDLNISSIPTYLNCPRKFYYESILNLTADFAMKEQNFQESVSSKDRGTKIHKEMETVFREVMFEVKEISVKELLGFKFHELRDKYGIKIKDDWIDHWTNLVICNGLNNLENIKIEESLNFQIDNKQIRGRADFIFLSNNRNEVIDFKSGEIKDIENRSYRFQCQLYALGLYENLLVDKKMLITCRLYFLDMGIEESWTVDYETVLYEWECFWQNYSTSFIKNTNYCNHCSFVKFCHH